MGRTTIKRMRKKRMSYCLTSASRENMHSCPVLLFLQFCLRGSTASFFMRVCTCVCKSLCKHARQRIGNNQQHSFLASSPSPTAIPRQHTSRALTDTQANEQHRKKTTTRKEKHTHMIQSPTSKSFPSSHVTLRPLFSSSSSPYFIFGGLKKDEAAREESCGKVRTSYNTRAKTCTMLL